MFFTSKIERWKCVIWYCCFFSHRFYLIYEIANISRVCKNNTVCKWNLQFQNIEFKVKMFCDFRIYIKLLQMIKDAEAIWRIKNHQNYSAMYQKILPFNQVVLFFQNMLKIICKRTQAEGSLQLIFLLILRPSLQQSVYLGFPQVEDSCFNFHCLKILKWTWPCSNDWCTKVSRTTN